MKYQIFLDLQWSDLKPKSTFMSRAIADRLKIQNNNEGNVIENRNTLLRQN